MSALSAMVMMLGLVVTGQDSAQAATYGWVYISFPTWLANCESGGRVTGVQAYTSYWSTTWDWGEDLVYGKVALNQRNTVPPAGWCRAPSSASTCASPATTSSRSPPLLYGLQTPWPADQPARAGCADLAAPGHAADKGIPNFAAMNTSSLRFSLKRAFICNASVRRNIQLSVRGNYGLGGTAS